MPKTRRRTLPVAALTAATVLLSASLAGCSGGSDAASSGKSASASPTPSSTVTVPHGVALTKQGSNLRFGDTARVIFESTQNQGTVLQLTVGSVRRGRLSDFSGFILDDANKRQAAYYYARVRVKNVGEGDVGGVPVPLWGVNSSNVLLPPVNFTTHFARCPSPSLPHRFAPGAVLSTCLVYLAPEHGRLTAVSYRPSQAFDPIVWKGAVEKPLPVKKKSTTKHKKKK